MIDKHLHDINITHPLQVDILKKLRHQQKCEYNELLPAGMSGNEFI